MGKEAKIGLAVVAVLLLVFGGLLLSKLIPTDRSAGPQPTSVSDAATTTPPVPAREKPTVVTAQKDRAVDGGPINKGTWNKSEPASDAGSEATAGAPRASYMPAESRLRNRYASDQEPANETETEPPVRTARANPFSRGGEPAEDAPHAADPADGAPNRLDGKADDASALEPRRQPTRAVRNPLRRLSAEVPLNEVPSAAEIGTTVDDQHPASDPNVLEPVAEGEPLSLEPSRETQQSLEDQPAAENEPAENLTPVRPAPRSRYTPPGAAEQPVAETREAAPPADGKYTIQPNDNLWIVSEKVYGNGRYFKAIHEFNRSKLPQADRLTVGTQIDVPPVSVLEQNHPQLVPKQRRSVVVKPRAAAPAAVRQPVASGSDVYIVSEGDTLFDIARYELGKASRWGEIYDLNREALGDDFDYLQPGTELKMPPRGQSTDAITRQRGPGIQR